LEEVAIMRVTKIIIIVTAALLCVAATAVAHTGQGRGYNALVAGQDVDNPVGHADVWNTGKDIVLNQYDEEIDIGSKLNVEVSLADGSPWIITAIQIFVGPEDSEIPCTKKGNPIPGQFPYKVEYDYPNYVQYYQLVLDLYDDLGFTWGQYNSRIFKVAVHADLVQVNAEGEIIAEEGAWAWAGNGLAHEFEGDQWGWWDKYTLAHPIRHHFIDSPVKGHGYVTPTHQGTVGPDEGSGFWGFPGELVDIYIGSPTNGFYVGTAELIGKKISPLDLFSGADIDDPRVVGVARVLQSLDSDGDNGVINIYPEVANCFTARAAEADFTFEDWGDEAAVDNIVTNAVAICDGWGGATLTAVSADEAKGNLEAGLNASGIFRKNVSKTEDWAEDKQKLEVMPVYFPGVRSNGNPSLCYDANGNGIYDDGDQLGVPYEEWRLNGDPTAEECDPRVDGEACVVTLIECREIAKPLLVTYQEDIDIHDDQVTTDFWPGRFSWDVYTAVSRDDGTTWKRMNVSRMADLSSFELETGEPFPGTNHNPYLKIDDNFILNVWESKYCKSGRPRYAINRCDDPETEEVETLETGCAYYCTGNPDNGTEVCEPDYPYDDDYYVTDIWGVRGQQRSVNYDEVDDVAELGIGEIPYSCVWAARGVIVSQKELDEGTFNSLNVVDDPLTPEDETATIELGDIVWFKPERITSGRRDAYLPMVGSARGAGFAIVWQEDPDGLRPGKGKGPGEGWSGAISNHKTDIWYTFIRSDDFAVVDENFVSGGPGDDAEPNEDSPGLGRPKALVPFALPVRISDNDMVNTHTLKVEASSQCVTPPDGTEPICFPEVVDDSFVPLYEDDYASLFCGHPDADPTTCCDPNNHEGDPNCEDLKGYFGNLKGTKRYAYMAATIDEYGYDLDGNYVYMPGGDGTPDYQYYVDRGGTLDLCDTTGNDSYFEVMPGSGDHERWFGFTNVAGASKLVCVSSDGRLLDGDVYAARPMIQLQPYTKTDGTKSAWVLLAYEESKGLGHSLAAEEHEDLDVLGDEIIGEVTDDNGQEKPIKQDLGKNLLYHSFDFTQPDLVAPGHIVNLPALCGGIYPTYCDDPKTPDVIETNENNPTCTCVAGQPVPLYFDYWDPAVGEAGEWIPDSNLFLQYRTEIARRARFLVQPYSRLGATRTAGAIIFKQGQEGQGRPADAFIRRIVVPEQKSSTNPGGFNPKVDNPYAFENFECTTYLNEDPVFGSNLPGCPTDGIQGYNCNVWGEAAGDLLCGGTFDDPNGGYPRRDHINLTSHDVDLAVDAGPDDDTPEDPTDDRYGTNKVLLWSQHDYNLGDESYGFVDINDGTPCAVIGQEQDPVTGEWTTVEPETCPAMYSNVRSHRGFIRSDFLVTAFSLSPNWAAGRNGNDRYNFYVRRSFDGGQTWTTDPAGAGVYVCPEYRSDPTNPDPDGSGNLPPQVLLDSDAGDCGFYDPATVPDGELPPLPVEIAATNYLDPVGTTPDGLPAQHIAAGAFEPARNISQIKNNHESSGDPRLGTTPPVYPLDGQLYTQDSLCPNRGEPGTWECIYPEDEWVDNMFFVAWGTVDNLKSTGSTGVKAEASPLDIFYTRTEDYGDTFLKVPWVIGGTNSNQGVGETVWRYDYLAKGEPEEQGECQLKATADGSKVYAIYHSMISEEEDWDEYTRWYPWEPEVTWENDVWFRRVIFWPDADTPLP